MALDTYPFDSEKLVGAISEIGPNYVRAAFVVSMASGNKFLHGQNISPGNVGDYVLIDVQDRAVLGRVIKIRLPEKERKQIEPSLAPQDMSRPIADIQILSSISMLDGKTIHGLTKYPSLGARVYLAPADILKDISSSGADEKITLSVAHLPSSPEHEIKITPERLFGRHCAVLGTTGGGKSWTVARLVEQTKKFKSKVILFDPSGEFWKIGQDCVSLYFGNDPTPVGGSVEVVAPYNVLTESDLLALFNPSGQTQAPKLRAAMKSLKLAKLAASTYTSGFVPKAGQNKNAYHTLYRQFSQQIEGPKADFDISYLTRQIQEECVYPSGGTGANPNYNIWGNQNPAEIGYIVSMLARIDDMISSPDLASLFAINGKKSVFDEIDAFMNDKNASCLRISFKNLSFAYSAREIICNALGRYLLRNARGHKFKESPVVIFLDEAHQFLNKHIGDENTKFPLDAFDLIAKEGRKYCLNICLATQRPRDIPEGVLSQMGTLIVHRLINEKDREVVERASGEIDKNAADFLPTLTQGQALIVGVDFPAPLTVQISKPVKSPDSDGPNYQKKWNLRK